MCRARSEGSTDVSRRRVLKSPRLFQPVFNLPLPLCRRCVANPGPRFPIEMKNIENGYIHALPARPRAAASKNSDNRLFSRGKEDRQREENSLLLSRYPIVLYDRSIDPSIARRASILFFKASNRIESSRIIGKTIDVENVGQDRVGESAPFLCPPRAPLEAAACRALGPTLPFPPPPRVSICRTLPRAADGKCYRQCVVSETTLKSCGNPTGGVTGSIERKKRKEKGCTIHANKF